MRELMQVCDEYLDGVINEDEFARRLAGVIRAYGLEVEVAECSANNLGGWR